MNRWIPLAIVGFGFAAAILVSYNQRSAEAQITTLSPIGTSVVLSTTSAQVIGANPSRRSITFCNPSTIIEWIAPAPIVPLTGGGVGIGLPAAATGTTVCFSTPIIGTAGQGQAWNAVSASATPNITILEYP
jgi:hypothetical protein